MTPLERELFEIAYTLALVNWEYDEDVGHSCRHCDHVNDHGTMPDCKTLCPVTRLRNLMLEHNVTGERGYPV